MTAAPKATTHEGDDQEREGHLAARPQLPPLSSICSDEAKLGEGEAEKGGSIEELLQDSLTYTDEQYKRVLRKQDLILLPLMWLCVSCPSPPLPGSRPPRCDTDRTPAVVTAGIGARSSRLHDGSFSLQLLILCILCSPAYCLLHTLSTVRATVVRTPEA